MSSERFQSTGKSSFYGDYLYDQIVPQDHFLRKLREVVPWQRFTYKLVKYYKGKARTGRPPIEPSLVPPTGHLSYGCSCCPICTISPSVTWRGTARRTCLPSTFWD